MSQIVVPDLVVPDVTPPDVRDFLIQVCGLPASEIAPDQRLLQDLGVDGDDAVGLFLEFETWFGGDLTPLYDHWRQHFNGEGYSLADGARLFVGALPILLAAVFTASWAGLPEWAGMGMGFAGLWVWIGPLKSWPWRRPPPLIPITVGNFVQAADSGDWPLAYSTSPAKRA